MNREVDHGRVTIPRNPAFRVLLVRHGETEWSASGRHTSRTNVPLNERGRAQAELLRRRLMGQHFDLVMSSPLARALDTCRLVGLGGSAEITDDLREWDYGRYEGWRTPDIRVEWPGWLLWRDGVPDGETIEAVARRAERVVARLRQNEQDAVVFAHGHLLRVLGARWIALDATHGRGLALDPATVSILGWEREVPVIRLWNDDSHFTPIDALSGGDQS
jgi:broad specificity phosphatase PhoE